MAEISKESELALLHFVEIDWDLFSKKELWHETLRLIGPHIVCI